MSITINQSSTPTSNNIDNLKLLLLSFFFLILLAAIVYPWIKPEVTPLGDLNDRVHAAGNTPIPPGGD